MNTKAVSNNSFSATLQDLIEYPTSGIRSKLVYKNNHSHYNLICLAKETEIDQHSSSRDAVLTVLEGRGNLNLEGKDIALAPSVFVFMPANAPHAVQAQENLAFVLALSEHASVVPKKVRTPESIREEFNIQNPSHAIYLSIGDRDW